MRGEILSDVALHMADEDTVATAIDDLDAGTEIVYDEDSIVLVDDISFGHKIALVPCQPGETVVKYGESIGRVTAPIESGEWVHTHNCESTRGRGDVSVNDERGI